MILIRLFRLVVYALKLKATNNWCIYLATDAQNKLKGDQVSAKECQF
jgi:hypothetical protein